MSRRTLRGILLALASAFGGSAFAEDPGRIAVTIKDHRFEPAEIHVPVGKSVTLVVTNEDATPE